jgi:ligand-binding sensor protein
MQATEHVLTQAVQHLFTRTIRAASAVNEIHGEASSQAKNDFLHSAATIQQAVIAGRH